FSSRRRHTRWPRDWSSDVCSSDLSRALVAALGDGLRAAGLPEDAIQLVPTRDRAAVGMMLTMSGAIDVIVPRGGKSLIDRVQREIGRASCRESGEVAGGACVVRQT